MPVALTSGVAWLDSHPWRQAVAGPVSGGNPAGCPADEIEAYDSLDTELMKRGTLQHGDIRWPWVGDEAARLLGQSKDIRLLSALLQAAQHRDARPAFPLALLLAVSFFASWGAACHPQGRMKAKLASRIVDQLHELYPKDATLFEEAGIYEACTRMAEAGARAGEVAFPELTAFFEALPGRLEALKNAAPEEPASEPVSGGSTPAHPKAKPAGSGEALRPSDLNLDPANERALKQSLVTVADFVHQLDPDHPLPYRLRRYATWYGVTSPPPIKTGQRTVLQAVSEETVERYRSAVERSHGDAETVTKLERTCHLQPFWIEGQLLACRLASAAGREAVAQAIQEETVRFVRSVPDMMDLSFSDGTPFVTREVAVWLETKPEAEPDPEPARQVEAAEPVAEKSEKQPEPGGFIAVDRQFQSTIRTVRAAAKKGDYQQALAMLDHARENAEGMRAASLWETVTLEALSEWGLKANVSSQARRLVNAIEGVSLSEWEPEIIRRLMRLI